MTDKILFVVNRIPSLTSEGDIIGVEIVVTWIGKVHIIMILIVYR